MTPSEIAGWHEKQASYIDTSTNRRLFHAQAAATIRAQAEALKIATEALEEIVHTAREMVGTAVDTDAAYAWAVALKATTDAATQALARIKEVGL